MIHVLKAITGTNRMVKKRQSVNTRKPSIIEEHQSIKISIRDINDKFEVLSYEDVFDSESDIEEDDNYKISKHPLYKTIFLREATDDEETTDEDYFDELFEVNEHGIYKRNSENDEDIVNMIKSSYDTELIDESNIIQVFLKSSKKYKILKGDEQLPIKTFNRIIILYGLTECTYDFLPWIKCKYFDDLMTKNDLGIDFDRLEYDNSLNKLKFKKDMKKGEFLRIGKTINVKRLEDISLVEMGLRCAYCNEHLKLRNVSVKNKDTKIKETAFVSNAKKTNEDLIKCKECTFCYCDNTCKEKDQLLHKELYHPSLKYKPNKAIDGKKFKTLLNFLLAKNMETVYTLLTSETKLESFPIFELNFANVFAFHENNYDDLLQAYDLYKSVFHPLSETYSFAIFLNELGSRYLLNVVVDLKNHNPTINDDHLLSPMLIFLQHASEGDNVELNMKENKLILNKDVKKGEVVKFNWYHSIKRHFSNLETQCSEYTLMKTHLGINVKTKQKEQVFLESRRRKSSVRFLDKVTAFNIN